MTRKNRFLKIALAGATALFVSMPSTASAQKALSTAKLRKSRCSIRKPRLRAGPMSIRYGAGSTGMIRASFWRPKIGQECGAEVRVQILDLEDGTVIDERIEALGDGEATLIKVELGGGTSTKVSTTLLEPVST